MHLSVAGVNLKATSSVRNARLPAIAKLSSKVKLPAIDRAATPTLACEPAPRLPR